MPSFSGISIALQSVLTHQQAIEVIQHNVANASTPGYHRQEAVLRPGPTQGAPGLVASTISGKVGTGVILSSVRRYNLDFMDARFRNEQANTKRWEIESDFLRQVEGALDETGAGGINAKLDAFWSGWKAVSTDPEDTALRANLLEQGKGLASAFSGRMEDLYQIQRDADLKIVQSVEEINQIAQQVARLNAEIGRFSNDTTQPNDYLDEQARYLDRLSELAGAKIAFENNGQAMVSISGHVLVQGVTAQRITTEISGSNENMVDIKWADAGGQYLYKYTENGEYLDKYLPTGELAGLFDIRDVVIRGEKESLNQLAVSVMENVNAAHRVGYGLDDDTPRAAPDYVAYPSGSGFGYPPNTTFPLKDFFVIDTTQRQYVWQEVSVGPPPVRAFVSGSATPPGDLSTAAISIRVNPVLDNVREINAATDAGVSGDGRNAEFIFKYQTQSTSIYTVNPDYDSTSYDPADPTTYAYLDTENIDTINHANAQRVAELALTVQRTDTLAKQHKNLVDVMEAQRESVNGVSLDEEAANLVKYQRSYQASIRLMTSVDEMLDRVINNMGLVGR